MKKLLLFLPLLFLVGCAGMSDKVVTTVTDTAGNVTETVAGSSIAKERAVHKTLQNESTGYYKALSKTGSKMGIVSFQEISLPDGSKAFLPLITVSFIEAPARNTHLPTKPSDHPVWGVVQNVAKYGFMAYGVHEVSGLVSSLVSGASGIEINGDSNVIQGAQNKAGGNQGVNSDYVNASDLSAVAENTTTDNSIAENNPVDNSDGSQSDNSNVDNTNNSDSSDSSDNSNTDNTDNSNNSQQPDNSAKVKVTDKVT